MPNFQLMNVITSISRRNCFVFKRSKSNIKAGFGQPYFIAFFSQLIEHWVASTKRFRIVVSAN